ncbi:hypothetical protein [Burkholderia multivorans]|uniref:hypothetical protein n=1 Tax=Burkholderia multivorans TaxID=87883 RepID=UPI0021C07282|nr:hypothetical protein [Burkholderia multivorans]
MRRIAGRIELNHNRITNPQEHNSMSARKVKNLRVRAETHGRAQSTIAGYKVQATRGYDDKIRFKVDGRRISGFDLLALVASAT